MVEGPKWAIIPYGFVRFRLEREKAYIFCCITDADFKQYMKIMKEVNPDMVLKGIWLGFFLLEIFINRATAVQWSERWVFRQIHGSDLSGAAISLTLFST